MAIPSSGSLLPILNSQLLSSSSLFSPQIYRVYRNHFYYVTPSHKPCHGLNGTPSHLPCHRLVVSLTRTRPPTNQRSRFVILAHTRPLRNPKALPSSDSSLPTHLSTPPLLNLSTLLFPQSIGHAGVFFASDLGLRTSVLSVRLPSHSTSQLLHSSTPQLLNFSTSQLLLYSTLFFPLICRASRNLFYFRLPPKAFGASVSRLTSPLSLKCS